MLDFVFQEYLACEWLNLAPGTPGHPHASQLFNSQWAVLGIGVKVTKRNTVIDKSVFGQIYTVRAGH